MLKTMKHPLIRQERLMILICILYGLSIAYLMQRQYGDFQRIQQQWQQEIAYEEGLKEEPIEAPIDVTRQQLLSQLPIMSQPLYQLQALHTYFEDALIKKLAITPMASTSLDEKYHLAMTTYHIHYTTTKERHHQVVGELIKAPAIIIQRLTWQKDDDQITAHLVVELVYRYE